MGDSMKLLGKENRKTKNSVDERLASIKMLLNKIQDSAINTPLKEQILQSIDELDETISESSENAIDSKLSELLKHKEELEESNANLVLQLENTPDSIWAVDSNLKIKTINSNFKKAYKQAYGVELVPGMSVVKILPEPVKSIWKNRYMRALYGETFRVTDLFELSNNQAYMETSFNPVMVNSKYVGVACFSRDITTQKLNEIKFKNIFEYSSSAISIQSSEKILQVNKAWENITGYTQADFESLPPLDLIHPDSRARVAKLIRAKTKGQKVPNKYRLRIVTKQQQERLINVSIAPIDYEGKKVSIIFGYDITKEYKLQEKLAKDEASLNSIFESTDARIWSVDKEFKFVSFNSKIKSDLYEAFNIDIQEGGSVFEGLSNKQRKVWKNRYLRALKGEKFTLTEELNVDGDIRFTEISLNPVYINNKIAGASCFSRDITQQKIAQNLLRESEQRFKTLVSNIPCVIYRCLPYSNWAVDFISEEVKKLSGYKPEEFTSHAHSLASLIHPDDKEITLKKILSKIEKRESYAVKYRILNSDGNERWVLEKGRAQYDENDEVLWLNGIISDISKQHLAKEALTESEEKYKNIFKTMTDIYVRSDLNGTIELITPSIYEIFGYVPEEIIGRTLEHLFKTPGDRDILHNQVMNKGYVREFETEFIAKDTSIKTVSINLALVKDNSGNPIAIDGVARNVSTQKAAEKELKIKTKELNTIFDNAPVILLLVDEKGKVININRSVNGLSNERKLKSINKLGREILNCINASSNPNGCGKSTECPNCKIRQTLHKTLKTKTHLNQVEGSIKVRNNGKESMRHYLISTNYIELENSNQVLISLDDITDIKRAQEQLKKLSVAVEQSTATILITDVKGDIQYANPQFEKTTGYSLEQVKGKNPRILRSKNKSPEDYRVLWNTILSGKTWQGEFLNVKQDGIEYWENAIISPIFNDDDEIISFIAIKDDITERKRIQEELIKSEKELRQMNYEKNRFISILAHDLRGLVGGYHAYSDLVHTQFDSFTKSEIREQLLNLSLSSGESLKLLDNLLEWGKASLGKTTVSINPVSLCEETESVFQTLKDAAKKKNITLINQSEKSIELYSDPHVIQTVLRNLVNNAIKFTPQDGTITVEYKMTINDAVRISVEDNGIGMDKEILDNLFNPGKKNVRTGTNEEKGTGLGLLICEEMVKQLGGNLWVESETGKGSKFFFDIPYQEINEENYLL